MTRDQEDNSGTHKRHYVARSFEKVQMMIKLRQWNDLFEFSHAAIMDIIRERCVHHNIHSEFMVADPIVFLEHALLKNAITHPEYYEALNI